jgi:hypothetical protein
MVAGTKGQTQRGLTRCLGSSETSTKGRCNQLAMMGAANEAEIENETGSTWDRFRQENSRQTEIVSMAREIVPTPKFKIYRVGDEQIEG